MLENPEYVCERPEVVDDAFSAVLKLANARSVMSGGFEAGGRWAIRFDPPTKIKFSAVARGSCWLRVDGKRAPVRVEAGDVLLAAPQGRGFVFASDLTVTPVGAASAFAGASSPIAKIGTGGDFLMVGGHVQLDGASGELLSDVLPPSIHVQAASPQAAVLRWLVHRLVHEQLEARPGAGVASAQLAQLMFVHVLRAHLETERPLATGWLRAMGDERLAPALRLMHGDPGRAWQIGELAKAAAMSRSSFALHFKSVAGIAPLAYLTEWRMRIAKRALQSEDTPVSTLARSLGYTSESAFSNAFKRVTGSAPRHYRSAVRTSGAAGGSGASQGARPAP